MKDRIRKLRNRASNEDIIKAPGPQEQTNRLPWSGDESTYKKQRKRAVSLAGEGRGLTVFGGLGKDDKKPIKLKQSRENPRRGHKQGTSTDWPTWKKKTEKNPWKKEKESKGGLKINATAHGGSGDEEPTLLVETPAGDRSLKERDRAHLSTSNPSPCTKEKNVGPLAQPETRNGGTRLPYTGGQKKRLADLPPVPLGELRRGKSKKEKLLPWSKTGKTKKIPILYTKAG